MLIFVLGMGYLCVQAGLKGKLRLMLLIIQRHNHFVLSDRFLHAYFLHE
jgi:hypothetical protein